MVDWDDLTSIWIAETGFFLLDISFLLNVDVTLFQGLIFRWDLNLVGKIQK